jgi:predicted enzyme related to lactoylglutathione lyase
MKVWDGDLSMLLDFQLNVLVEDVETCVSFYKAIGFEETYRTPDVGPAEHVEVRAIGLTLGISAISAARDLHGIDVATDGNAVQLCLWCADIDATFEQMLRLGAQAVRSPRDFRGGRLRNAWLRDPGNNVLQLVQRVAGTAS